MEWIFGAIAGVLTMTLFLSKESMLGYGCVIFWSLFGWQLFNLSTAAWDFYFMAGFGIILGMNVLTAYGAYGLRERRDAIGEVQMEEESEDIDSEKEESEEEDTPRARRAKRRGSRI